MNKKTKIIFILLGFLALAGVGVAGAWEQLWDSNNPESIKLEEMARQGKLTEEDWKNLRDRYEQKQKWLNMSDEEKMRIKEKEYHQFLKDRAEMMSRPPQPLPEPELGIIEDGVDPFLGGSVFRQLDTVWRGYVDDEKITVVTGFFHAYPSGPLQGIVAVMDGSWDYKPKQYPTPTATGPVQIIEENDGILTLESLAGEYEVYDINTDTREWVSTPGNEVYYFNLKERRFQ